MLKVKFSALILVSCFIWSRLYAEEFSDELERDYSLRSIGSLSITNTKGGIQLQGWPQDKIRIKIKKVVKAESLDQAKRLFALVDYRYSVSDGNIEVSSQYGKDVSIEDRLKEGDRSDLRLDMVISAPSYLKLKAWSIDGKITLKTWASQIHMRSKTGPIQIENVKGSEVSIACTECTAHLKNIDASVRCMGGEGLIDLNNITGKNIFAETTSGPLKLSHIEGGQLYVSRSGPIEGQFLKGKIDFRTQQSDVTLREVIGFLSGTADSGDINASVRDWKFTDKALIESIKGNINLTLPRIFSGDIDIWSLHGKTNVEFPWITSQQEAPFGPEPANHIVGKIRNGGELLKIFTSSGNINVSKEK